MRVKGRNLIDGLPKDAVISAKEIREALTQPLMQIVEAVKRTLENTPPELSADVMESGITLSGGGALLRGIDKLISEQTNMPVFTAKNPLDCVAFGAGKCLGADFKHDFNCKKR